MKGWLTWDYEIYMGTDQGNWRKSVINNTKSLTDIMAKYNVVSTFFVDTLFLLRLKELGEIDTLENFEKQLVELYKIGHDIQLHIHPHWINSKIDKLDRWIIDYNYYQHSSLTKEEIDFWITESCLYLKELLPDIKLCVFRAGGFCVEPFDNLSESLLKNGIFIDSSVYASGFDDSKYQKYDFRQIPTKHSWKFNVSPLSLENGRFVEVPLTSINMTLRDIIGQISYKFTGYRSEENNGSSIHKSFIERLINLSKSRSVPMSVDGYKMCMTERALDSNAFENIVILGHPKTFSGLRERLNFDRFLKRASSMEFVWQLRPQIDHA